MSYIPQNGGTVSLVLATAVTDSSTFTTVYPTGFTLVDFNCGLADYGVSHMMVNKNDKVLEGSGGIALSFGASTITVTNNTGATLAAGTIIDMYYASRRGNKVLILGFQVDLAGVTAADVVTEMRPGVDGYIENIEWVTRVPVTTGSKLASFNLEIGTTNVTGGVIALTSALATPLGAVVEGTQITAANRLVKGSKLSIEASAVTAFAEGSGTIYVRIRLDD